MRYLQVYSGSIILMSIALVALVSPTSAYAKSTSNDIKEVLWVTETWHNFTEQDGQGLYHEIVDAVFAHAGITVKKEYVPFKRALYLLKKERADLTLGVIRSESLLMSAQPILSSKLSLIYNKDKVAWSSKSDLTKYVGTWPEAYENEFGIKGNRQLNGFASSNRDTAIVSLLNGKADYYVDTHGMMKQTLSPLDKELLKNYNIRAFEAVHLRAAFPDSKRGRAIKAIFEESYSSLIRTGALDQIYNKFGVGEKGPLIPTVHKIY